jgi:hypothetical protein
VGSGLASAFARGDVAIADRPYVFFDDLLQIPRDATR